MGESSKKETSDLNTTLQLTNENVANLQKQIEELNKQIVDEKTNVSNLGQHLQARDQIIQQQKQQVEKIIADSTSNFDLEKSKLQDQINLKQNLTDDLKNTVASLEAEKLQSLEQNDGKINSLSEQLRMLQEDANLRAADFSNQQEKRESDVRLEMEELKNEIKKEQMATAKVEAERDMLQEKMETLKIQHENTSNESFQQSVTWRREKMQLESSVLDYKNQIEKIVASHQNELKLQQQDLHRLKERHKIDIEHIEQDSKNSSKKEISELTVKLENETKENQNKISKLERETTEQIAEIERLKVKVIKYEEKYKE